MATDKMIARKDGAIGWMTFNNPERHNAVSLEMWQAVGDVLDDFERDEAIKVVVLTGAGGKAFVSGADISKFESERASAEAVAAYGKVTEHAHGKLHGLTKPSIAMIRGYCIGGGLAVALGCDLRICSEGSRFAVPAAKLGLGYGYSGIKRLIDVVGPSFAQEIFFTARQFSSEEAAGMRLVNRVVPDAELESYVTGYARTIAANAPMTIKAVKQAVVEALKDPEDRDLGLCARMVKACFDSHDYIEGRRAFMEKRKPVFTGR